MRELARLGFILLGIYFIVAPFTSVPGYILLAGAESRELGAEFLLEPLLFWAVFNLVPGVLLAARSRALAHRLFPGPQSDSLSIQSLTAALLCVLGMYLVVQGFGTAAGKLPLLILFRSFDAVAADYIASLVAAVLTAGAGIFLAAKAQMVAGFLYRSDR